jgi:hypothetical protein
MTRARTKPRRPGQTGGQVQELVKDYLARVLGVAIERNNTGAGTYTNADGSARKVRYGAVGAGDLRGTLKDGRTIEVEAKATGELPTEAQMARVNRLNELGGVGIWTDELDFMLKVMPYILQGYSIRYDERDWRQAYLSPPKAKGE